ncbi:MAG: hypothetical protein K1X74_05310 [Pirellulales bacterium]|nr:hypothetical protein [Pirellulales bacterium]
MPRAVGITRATVLLVLLLICTAGAQAAPTIVLELGTMPGFPVTEAQRWSQLLGEICPSGVSIREARNGEQPEVATDRGASSVTYRVFGLLTPRNELLLPRGQFKPTDRRAIAAWFERLANEGPEVSTAAKRPPYGLEAGQLLEVGDDLRPLLGVSTKGRRPRAVLEEVGADLGFPLEVTAAAFKALDAADPISEELQDLARGTALAALVRPAGLGFRPLRTPDGEIEYRIEPVTKATDVWPVGWPLTDNRTQHAPQLFESLTVAIDDIPLAEALAAIQSRIKLPLLYDHSALARARIDLGAKRVSLPEKRSTYSLVLQSLLVQSRLTWEVRLDDADRPLIWITTARPSSR